MAEGGLERLIKFESDPETLLALFRGPGRKAEREERATDIKWRGREAGLQIGRAREALYR